MGIFNPSGSVKRWTMAALNENKALTNESLANLNPYSSQGGAAWGKLGDLMGLNGAAAGDAALAGYRTSPGYQFQLQEGTNALERGAAARGGLYSGAQMKALQGYGQNLADSDMGNYLGRLSGMAGVGYGAANAENALRSNLGQMIYGGYTGIGNAKASQGAAMLGGLGNLLGGAMTAFGGNALSGLTGGVSKLFGGGAAGMPLDLTPQAGRLY